MSDIDTDSKPALEFADGPSAPDPEAAVERARKSSSTERVRKYRERQKQGDAKEPDPAKEAPKDYTASDIEQAEAATACGVVWSLAVVPFSGGRVRDLDEPQSKRLGIAFAPLLKKYLPMLASWQLEITAAFVLVNVVRECYIAPEPEAAGHAEVPKVVTVAKRKETGGKDSDGVPPVNGDA